LRLSLDEHLVRRLYRRAGSERWKLSLSDFTSALEISAERAFRGRSPGRRELEKYLSSLHLQDLALACACAAGHEAAWERFILEQRPALYRAADALQPGGGARDLADSLYGELYGIDERGGGRRSMLAYYHGRSSLTTWLRAVLAQRYVDRVRVQKRIEPLGDDQPASAIVAADPDRLRFVSLMRDALARALFGLTPRDRTRLACYYAQQLTLAETGRLLGEHEATVSRQLARSRRRVREDIERHLREAGLTSEDIAACVRTVIADTGPLNLDRMFSSAVDRKDSDLNRSG
jgi:RNA polymerase sigma factor (sigma-70 family)